MSLKIRQLQLEICKMLRMALGSQLGCRKCIPNWTKLAAKREITLSYPVLDDCTVGMVDFDLAASFEGAL